MFMWVCTLCTCILSIRVAALRIRVFPSPRLIFLSFFWQQTGASFLFLIIILNIVSVPSHNLTLATRGAYIFETYVSFVECVDIFIIL